MSKHSEIIEKINGKRAGFNIRTVDLSVLVGSNAPLSLEDNPAMEATDFNVTGEFSSEGDIDIKADALGYKIKINISERKEQGKFMDFLASIPDIAPESITVLTLIPLDFGVGSKIDYVSGYVQQYYYDGASVEFYFPRGDFSVFDADTDLMPEVEEA